jgi:hypothetical protein
LLGEGFNTQFHENVLKGKSKTYDKKKIKAETYKTNTLNYEDYENDGESSDNSELEDSRNSLFGKNQNLEKNIKINNQKEINLIYPKITIFETAIFNLKIIYHLMELDNLLEGESSFDKLCVLATNLIDFIIEYIDTLEALTYIIDNNFIKLFFGSKYDKTLTADRYMDKKGILPLFTMKIKEKYEDDYQKSFNKYKLRKTMLAYMKIKYFQLLKMYLQFGNKNHFVQLLLSEHLGPFELFEQILYYMKELINNLVYKNYDKYHHLLNVDNINLYINKLNNLYKFEEEFRTSIEISVVFQICMILVILENIYKIKKLRDNFNKFQVEGNNEEIIFNEVDNNKNNLNVDIYGNIKELNLYENNYHFNINNDILFRGDKNEDDIITDRNYYFNSKKGNFENDDKDEDENDDTYKGSHINFISTFLNNDDCLNSLTETDNQKNNKKNNFYNKIKRKFSLKKREKKKVKLVNKEKKKLGDENLNLNSKFSKAVYKFLNSLISKVEIRVRNNDNLNEKEKNYNSLTKEISKRIIKYKSNDVILSNINYEDIFSYNLDNNVDYELSNEESSENNIENKENDIDDGKKYVFFIKPYLSFHLSEQTKSDFLNNVNRNSALSKYK